MKRALIDGVQSNAHAIKDLIQQGRCGVRLFVDVPAMMEHFAESMADELRVNNAVANPTRRILRVGPVAQYSRLVELSNRERISWRNVFTFTGYLRRERRRQMCTHPTRLRPMPSARP